MDFYEELLKNSESLKKANEEIGGMDDFLKTNMHKVASLNDLTDFFRISTDTLVHKAEKDLWRLKETSTGDVFIERLFDPTTHEAIRV